MSLDDLNVPKIFRDLSMHPSGPAPGARQEQAARRASRDADKYPARAGTDQEGRRDRGSSENGMQHFDVALFQLYKAQRISLEDALAYADSRANLKAKINFE